MGYNTMALTQTLILLASPHRSFLMNTSLFEISQAQLQEMFGSTTFQRGSDYKKTGRVKIVSSTENSSKLTIRADIKGTQRRPYQVQVSLEQNEFEIWSESRCSCPVGANCKHCVAAILSYFTQAKALLQSEKKAASNRKSPSTKIAQGIAK